MVGKTSIPRTEGVRSLYCPSPAWGAPGSHIPWMTSPDRWLGSYPGHCAPNGGRWQSYQLIPLGPALSPYLTPNAVTLDTSSVITSIPDPTPGGVLPPWRPRALHSLWMRSPYSIQVPCFNRCPGLGLPLPLPGSTDTSPLRLFSSSLWESHMNKWAQNSG